MDKNDLKMPTEQELAEIVYDYCKKNKITSIREDELIKRISEDEIQDNMEQLQENYSLDENGWGKDEESSNAVTITLGKHLMFTYKLAKRFYDIIDILIEENKAERIKVEGERLYYLDFYLNPLEIESVRLVKSTIDIYANDLYENCKTNNIEYLKKDEISNIIDLNDVKMIDKIVELLVKENKARTFILKDSNICCIMFALKEKDIKINENIKLMIKNLAELLLDKCNENQIEYIEKDEFKKLTDTDDDRTFKYLLDYLVERHLADEEYNTEDGKKYIRIYC